MIAPLTSDAAQRFGPRRTRISQPRRATELEIENTCSALMVIQLYCSLGSAPCPQAVLDGPSESQKIASAILQSLFVRGSRRRQYRGEIADREYGLGGHSAPPRNGWPSRACTSNSTNNIA